MILPRFLQFPKQLPTRRPQPARSALGALALAFALALPGSSLASVASDLALHL